MATGKEHQAEGMVDKIKGAVKEGFGALTGDRSTEAEGKAERAKGALQEKYGEVKDSLTNDPAERDPNRTGTV
jgi:uncharacterized protein YjbJ (UPF0337 family)